MSKRRLSLVLVALTVAIGAILNSGGPAVSIAQAQDANSYTFPETGKTVTGRFLQYWQEGGGLEQFGYPISDPIGEMSSTDGQLYTVQYFERALFEFHPEKQPPNDVLLALLGSFTYQERYPYGASPQVPADFGLNDYFSATGKHVCCEFYTYWHDHGGLATQGYPITDLLQEISALDGSQHIVQYFERATYELHLGNGVRPDYVLLSQLGTFRYQAKYAGRSAPFAPPYGIPPALLRSAPTSTPKPAPTARPTATSRPYVPPTTPPSTGARCGATCNDGTHSNATGSGACSHHGGVNHWLYCDMQP